MPSQTFTNLPEAKKERILAAAVNEFSQRNVEQANISNIVRDAGISRGSFYQYFQNKDDLYVYAFETLRGRRSQFTRPAFDLYKVEPFFKFFTNFYLRDCEFLLSHPQHIEMGKIMYSHGHGVSRGLIDAVQRRYRDTFLIALDYDQTAGRIRADVDLNPVVDLCVHLMTDVLIFQNFTHLMSMRAVEQYIHGIVDLLRHGTE